MISIFRLLGHSLIQELKFRGLVIPFIGTYSDPIVEILIFLIFIYSSSSFIKIEVIMYSSFLVARLARWSCSFHNIVRKWIVMCRWSFWRNHWYCIDMTMICRGWNYFTSIFVQGSFRLTSLFMRISLRRRASFS